MEIVFFGRNPYLYPMIQIQKFTFNPYQENTYVLYDQTGECVIIDPGMYGPNEEKELTDFIEQHNLTPVLLLNTHCHIDHVLGNHFIHETYGLIPQFHENELPLLIEVQNYAPQMGIRYDVSPIAEEFLTEADEITFGQQRLKLISAPGHSPGHLCFYHPEQAFLIGGDVLFYHSIGRTDLPRGNHQQLIDSIQSNIYTLPASTVVYPGHGPETTIGEEKASNPFVQAI